ncbi:MAG: hypothetical protein A2W31_11355 [Planctomycetes bacterium RBG_16_64_10]|nr:MAG: hypothetical protein A2W31_11355 [Planctomycetes bacterium RBG_16_64_10]
MAVVFDRQIGIVLLGQFQLRLEAGQELAHPGRQFTRLARPRASAHGHSTTQAAQQFGIARIASLVDRKGEQLQVVPLQHVFQPIGAKPFEGIIQVLAAFVRGPNIDRFKAETGDLRTRVLHPQVEEMDGRSAEPQPPVRSPLQRRLSQRSTSARHGPDHAAHEPLDKPPAPKRPPRQMTGSASLHGDPPRIR